MTIAAKKNSCLWPWCWYTSACCLFSSVWITLHHVPDHVVGDTSVLLVLHWCYDYKETRNQIRCSHFHSKGYISMPDATVHFPDVSHLLRVLVIHFSMLSSLVLIYQCRLVVMHSQSAVSSYILCLWPYFIDVLLSVCYPFNHTMPHPSHLVVVKELYICKHENILPWINHPQHLHATPPPLHLSSAQMQTWSTS